MTTANVEEWRTIPGYEGRYEVSSRGRVRNSAGRVLTTHLTPKGYPEISLGRRRWRVHALVCLAFIGPRPEGLQVRHLNDIKTDLSPSNLTYGTPSENIRDQVQNGRNSNATKRLCKRGHDLTDPANIYVTPGTGSRQCMPCVREISVGRRARARLRLAEDPSIAKHGRPHTYNHYGCRCDPCKASAAGQRAAIRARAS